MLERNDTQDVDIKQPFCTAKTPPAFIATGEADERVPPEHSHRIADALSKANVPAELHTYAGAKHGFALRGKGAEQVWPSQCEHWMRRMGFIDEWQ